MAGATGGRRGRALLGEFLVVMLGVLVALALEQLVHDWQERERARATLLAMNEELSDFLAVFRLRTDVSACVVRKLDALDAALAGPGTLAVASVGRTPYFFSSRGGWSAGGADLLARYRGPEVARVYGEIYQGMEEFARLAQQEQEHWARLATLERHARALEPTQRWRLAEAVAGARNDNLLLTAIAEQMAERIPRLGIEPAAMPAIDLAARPICQPLVPS